MQGNVQPCPHCGGTGEVRVEWRVGYRFQDCTEWAREGPFASREAAEAFAAAEKAAGVDQRHSCNIFVHEQVSQTGR